MKIAIIGAGNIGASLTKTLYLKSHNILIGTYNTNQSNILELLKLGLNIKATNVEYAVSISNLIIIAVSLQGLIDALNNFMQVEGKVIIEKTNSFRKAIQVTIMRWR